MSSDEHGTQDRNDSHGERSDSEPGQIVADRETAGTREAAATGMPLPSLPVTSVWLTCQETPRQQRKGRYVPDTNMHPAKMIPALAAHAVRFYTRPGDLVLDPMCGSGTTLVEAVRSGREAIGVEIEEKFTGIARANLALARQHGADSRAEVITVDATHLSRVMPKGVRGNVALVVTSPPYGSRTHGLVWTHRESGVQKSNYRYGPSGRGNLAYAGWERLLDGFTQIMAACYEALRPGGFVVFTGRPVRRQRDDLIDLPSQFLAAAASVGLVPHERCVALLAAVRDGQVIHRASMFAQLAARRARTAGIPVSVVAHEDVYVLRKPLSD